MKLSTRTKVRLARAVQAPITCLRASAGLDNHRCVVSRRGLNWQLDLTEGIDFSIYLMGGFELKTLALYRALIPRGAVVLDIGANVGAHTLPLAQLVGPRGRVCAVEPTTFAFEKRIANLALNPALVPRVTPLQAFIAPSELTAVESEVYSSWPLVGGSSLHEAHCGQKRSTDGAVALSIDGLVEKYSVTAVDFVKIDVDGHEPGVLLSAQRTLKARRPTILMEWARSVYGAKRTDIEDMLSLLRTLGYVAERPFRNENVPLTFAALDDLAPPGGSTNVLFRSRDALA
jgi:FkbM family methyltransferase